jgi:hypothetical protein
VTVGNCREASNKAANSVQEAARLFSRSLHNPGETCVPFDPISARTGCDGVEPRAGYDPEQEDEDKCEKHERIHRALLALLTNLPERGATNFSVAPDVPSKLLVVVVIKRQMMVPIATVWRMSDALCWHCHIWQE